MKMIYMQVIIKQLHRLDKEMDLLCLQQKFEEVEVLAFLSIKLKNYGRKLYGDDVFNERLRREVLT